MGGQAEAGARADPQHARALDAVEEDDLVALQLDEVDGLLDLGDELLIPRERAWDHVGGLTVLNDVTMRDFQRRTIQRFAGKTFSASTPVGPWVVTPDELGDLTDRELSVTVNGEQRQRAPLGDLVFDVPALVADLSAIVELQPGDIIATGTPGGVGEASKRFLAAGDVVEVTIDGIGTIRSTFTEPAA